MREREQELQALGIEVVVVSFEAGFTAKAYAADTALSWPILVDESRDLYRAYGMLQGRWWTIWGPSTWLAYARLLLRGRRLQKSSADINQLGGDVLIDPEGVVRLHHVGAGPADRPSVASLIACTKARASQGPPSVHHPF